MNAQDAARSVAQRLAPGLMADRARRYERGYRRGTGATALAESIAGDGRVSGGPFAGMRLGRPLDQVDAAPSKLIGSYEEELAEVFLEAVGDGVPAFVDVGCADGYYAVGMPCTSPATTTYAFDLASSARRLCAATAAANQVTSRVRISGRCDATAMRRLPLDGALVLVDIEGAELRFFDGEVMSLLPRSRVVVEVHADNVPDASDVLQRRFAPSHEVSRVEQAARDTGAFPKLAGLTAEQARLAVAEHRGPELHWLIFTPR